MLVKTPSCKYGISNHVITIHIHPNSRMNSLDWTLIYGKYKPMFTSTYDELFNKLCTAKLNQPYIIQGWPHENKGHIRTSVHIRAIKSPWTQCDFCWWYICYVKGIKLNEVPFLALGNFFRLYFLVNGEFNEIHNVRWDLATAQLATVYIVQFRQHLLLEFCNFPMTTLQIMTWGLPLTIFVNIHNFIILLTWHTKHVQRRETNL